MKLFAVLLLLCFTGKSLIAQNIHDVINVSEVERIVSVLASDEMEGRKTFTPSIDRAADFIAASFKKDNLKYLGELSDYKQSFYRTRSILSSTGKADGKEISADKILAVSVDSLLEIDQNSGYSSVSIDGSSSLFAEAMKLLGENKKYIVWVHTSHEKNFSRLSRLKRESAETNAPIVFVLANAIPKNYSFRIKNKIHQDYLANVVGIIPGKSLKDEYVIFSAHYDHLGIRKPDATGDSIYNGANDNASGTTAVLLLANYFSKLNDNERSLIFVAFTAEEIGGFGSQYFSKSIDPDKVVAMFNLEMIGTDSKWGKNSAFITGYEKSDFGQILQANLVHTPFKFEPDPYPAQNLFYRSDNATLAALGVPAHTISTSKMDIEPNYHRQSDEVKTLDLPNMTEIIKAIALSSKSIISGKDTPSRVEKANR
ncbi:MAG: M28 family peptidase [Ginsengibacter sp.]